MEFLTPKDDARDVRLAIVTPLANEEDSIDEFLTRVTAQLTQDDRVLCVLDNVCKDRTKSIILERAKTDRRIMLVWAPENRCVVDAYFSGYRAALELNPRWILEMDGGLSHEPESIPRFIDAMQQGYDYAPGSRFIRGGSFSGPIKRYALSKGGTLLSNLILGTRMKDMTSGFECFSSKAMRVVVARGVKSRAHFFQTEIRHMLRDWKWVEVPISYKSPSNSVGKGTVVEALRNLWNLRKNAQREQELAAAEAAGQMQEQPSK